MKKHFSSALMLSLFALSTALGQTGVSLSQFKMSIKGTSNLHDWESSVKEVRGWGTVAFDAAGLPDAKALSVEIPVRSIKSTKGQIMDDKTHAALKSGSCPNINFVLEKVISVKKSGSGFELSAAGNLTIAGATKKVDLHVKGRSSADGSITFEGSKGLKMTDFGIKPPTALFGTLTTGDDVEIVFSVSFKRNNG